LNKYMWNKLSIRDIRKRDIFIVKCSRANKKRLKIFFVKGKKKNRHL